MRTSRQQLGIEGEDAALRFLEARGLQLLERNLRLGRSEIDLVLRDGTQTVFVEVKACRPGAISPLEQIGNRKLLALRRAIGMYLGRHPGVPSVRVDVIAAVRRGGGWGIDWVQGVL